MSATLSVSPSSPRQHLMMMMTRPPFTTTQTLDQEEHPVNTHIIMCQRSSTLTSSSWRSRFAISCWRSMVTSCEVRRMLCAGFTSCRLKCVRFTLAHATDVSNLKRHSPSPMESSSSSSSWSWSWSPSSSSSKPSGEANIIIIMRRRRYRRPGGGMELGVESKSLLKIEKR